MAKSFWVGALILALFVEPITQNARSQVLYGSIVGNVRDASEAAVAGATVAITNTETNFTRQATTSESGGYDLSAVPGGTYVLKVTKEGFGTYTLQRLQVTINTVSRADVSLNVGSLAESVTVSAEAAALQTDRSEVRSEMVS